MTVSDLEIANKKRTKEGKNEFFLYIRSLVEVSRLGIFFINDNNNNQSIL